jgi:beta-mannosidase
MWASNLTLEKRTVDVELKAWDVVSGRRHTRKASPWVHTRSKSQRRDYGFEVPVEKKDTDEEARIVVAAYLVEGGEQVARYVNWPEPLKYTHLQKPKKLNIRLSPMQKASRYRRSYHEGCGAK